MKAGTLILMVWVALASTATGTTNAVDDVFAGASQAYIAGDFFNAANLFRDEARRQPAPGTLQNLGNAEWRAGRTGPAILAWEQALWLNPRDADARNNLEFVRNKTNLEAPYLSWFEACSAWLPFNAWVWIASVSLWAAVGFLVLPGVCRLPRADWHQALAAASVAILVLSIPAMVGVHSRAKIGFVLPTEAPLHLTPTTDAQVLTKLPGGEPARLLDKYDGFVLVRTHYMDGWLRQEDFAAIASRP